MKSLAYLSAGISELLTDNFTNTAKSHPLRSFSAKSCDSIHIHRPAASRVWKILILSQGVVVPRGKGSRRRYRCLVAVPVSAMPRPKDNTYSLFY